MQRKKVVTLSPTRENLPDPTVRLGHISIPGTRFRRVFEQVPRGNPNGQDHANRGLEDGEHNTILRSTTLGLPLVRDYREPSGNRSRPVPTRCTYRCHRSSREISLCAHGSITARSASLGCVGAGRGCTQFVHGRSLAPLLQCGHDTEHVGFSPTRQTLLAPSAKRP